MTSPVVEAVRPAGSPHRSRNRRLPSGSTRTRTAAEATILGGALLVAAWPVRVAMAGPQPVPLMGVIAHVTGMLAGYGVLVLMTLMSRWPVLERGVGSDRLARWHAAGGRLVLTMILVHAAAAVSSWADSRDESPFIALGHVLRLPWLIAATVATTLLVAVAAVSMRSARRRMSHESWHALHLSTYVAIALSFLHQLGGPDLAGRPVLQVGWALLYTHAFGLVLRHRILGPVRAAARHRLRVVAVVPEAPGVVSLVLEGRDLHELRAEPGQFFRWRFMTPDLWLTAHPFSLSAPPTAERLRLTVKALGDGSRLLQQVDVGTWVIAEGPSGSLTASRRTRRDVLLIAGGVGITPLRSLFETIPLSSGQDLVLLYRARTPEEVVFRAELDAIAAERGARVGYLLGNDPGLLSCDSLRSLVPGLENRDVYLCGPLSMTRAVRSALARAGLKAGQIHEERFAY